ncbi:acetyl-CoA C-acetyltransferase [Granulosicoccus antarcticus]|uniref:3-ketoacyl-CoA thiolase n=1 Tax=Granulosicoccus antarcticus IMCC3135 TaxID=1192854 RepID=A0A2Z2P4B2_9GAMM|nr:acetyl-CoA C-acetyltransferase [Granulosicoccus antarcticus]ASJ75507.1 3-ketoacyl-CoA thiolase [Granulosicoccus antarcticus IMCC3135]
MAQTLKPVVIVGGLRIPFCRSNTSYAELSNKKMLSTVLNGMVQRYALEGQHIGEVNAGAVITHSRDWNLAREVVLSTKLSPTTPGLTMQQACGTSLQAAMTAAAKIATGQIDSAIAAGSDTVSDVPIVFNNKFSKRLVALGKARDIKSRLGVFKGFGPKELAPVPPSVNEPRTLMSMGQHCEMMAKTWSISRQAQDELALLSHQNTAAAYDSGFFDDLLIQCEGVLRDNNLRADASLESLGKLRTVYDKTEAGTLTAGNSTPLTDGAAGVLLCSEEWARERGLPIQAYLTHSATAAVDFVGGAGLLMAPTVAVSDMLKRAELTLQDFELYEIHEAFAAQVLCTLKAWEDPEYCRKELGRDTAMGSIDRTRMNVVGSSLAVGHPFAATGARILGTLAKQLDQKGSGRGLISICTAGGMGVTAILEK